MWLFVCPGLPWPCLWTNFETKGTYGHLMTQEWLEKIRSLNFEKKFFLKIFENFENFPPKMPLPSLNDFSLLKCIFPPCMPFPSLNAFFPPGMPIPSLNVLLECLFKPKGQARGHLRWPWSKYLLRNKKVVGRQPNHQKLLAAITISSGWTIGCPRL